jgi:hypothetical protein
MLPLYPSYPCPAAVTPAVIVRQRKPWRRKEGTFIYFEDNAGVIVNPKGEMKGEQQAGAAAASDTLLTRAAAETAAASDTVTAGVANVPLKGWWAGTVGHVPFSELVAGAGLVLWSEVPPAARILSLYFLSPSDRLAQLAAWLRCDSLQQSLGCGGTLAMDRQTDSVLKMTGPVLMHPHSHLHSEAMLA